MTTVWFELQSMNDRPNGRIGRDGDVLVAEWNGIGRLRVGRHSRAGFEAFPGADPRQVEKVEKGIAWLLCRSLEGHLGLHASAVRIDDQALVFFGPSGVGKSTLAAAMCERANGFLIADDATALERSATWKALPAERSYVLDEHAIRHLGLDPSASRLANGKLSLAGRSAPSDGVPLTAIFALEFSDCSPSIDRLLALEAMRALIPQVVRFAVDDEELITREMDSLVDIVSAIPVFHLRRPKRFDAVDRTIADVIALLHDQ